LTLKEVLGNNPSAIANIQNNNQIVFHSTGDCGSTRGPKTQNLVVDKMLADFKETATSEIPQFHILLGDVIYSFGEVKYYYDQFYEPYREYRVRFSRLPETTTAWQLPIRTRPASTASTETLRARFRGHAGGRRTLANGADPARSVLHVRGAVRNDHRRL
jgi:hypothetical protein